MVDYVDKLLKGGVEESLIVLLGQLAYLPE